MKLNRHVGKFHSPSCLAGKGPLLQTELKCCTRKSTNLLIWRSRLCSHDHMPQLGVDLGVELGISDQVYDPPLGIVTFHVELLCQHLDGNALVDSAKCLEDHLVNINNGITLLPHLLPKKANIQFLLTSREFSMNSSKQATRKKSLTRTVSHSRSFCKKFTELCAFLIIVCVNHMLKLKFFAAATE